MLKFGWFKTWWLWDLTSKPWWCVNLQVIEDTCDTLVSHVISPPPVVLPSCIVTVCSLLFVWPFMTSLFASCFGYLLSPLTLLAEGLKHREAIKCFWPRAASSSHPCAWFLYCFLASTVPALLLPPMCKWLGDRAERKHKLCFLDTEHARNSSGFTAVGIRQIPTGSIGLWRTVLLIF